MGDVLTRLIDRSMGLANVVRPVLPPVFAGRAAIADPIELPDEFAAGEGTSGPQASTNLKPLVANAASQFAQAETPQQDIFSLNLLCPKRITGAPPIPEVDAADVGYRGTLFLPEENVEVPVHSPPGKTAPQKSLISPEEVQGKIPPESEPFNNALSTEKRGPDARKSDHSPVSPAVSVYSLSPIPVQTGAGRGARSSMPSLRNKVIRPEVNVYSKVAEPLPAERRSPVREAASSPPTIHVTIGRIDVRAIMQQQPPSPKRTEPTAPKLTLEDYLKQRTEGRR